MSYFRCDDCGHKEYIFGQGGGKDLAKELNTDLLGQLPYKMVLPVTKYIKM